MPYGTATWSSLASPGVITRVKEEAKVFDHHVEVSLDYTGEATWGLTQIGSLIRHHENTTAAVIPLVADDHKSYFEGVTTQMIESKTYGICVFIMKPDWSTVPIERFSEESWVTVSNICFCPQLVNSLAMGRNPSRIHTQFLSRLKVLGFRYHAYPNPSGFTIAASEGAPCCICLSLRPTHRWSKCWHNSDHGWGTICESCRAVQIAAASLVGNMTLPCPLCRTPGLIVKLGSSK